MDYYIFRHAETFFSKNEMPYGDKVETAEILPEGIPAVERLADYLKDIKTDKNFVSPYLRCRQTTDIVGKITGWQFIVDQRLHDYNRQIESVSEMITRIKTFHKDLEGEKLQSVAICTHGYPISALIQLITTGSVPEEKLDNYPKPGILSVIKNKKVDIIDFN